MRISCRSVRQNPQGARAAVLLAKVAQKIRSWNINEMPMRPSSEEGPPPLHRAKRDLPHRPFSCIVPEGHSTPGILLAARLLASRAGALQGPISPTCQHAGANQMKRENHRSFLLLLFLTATAPVEFRYGAVVAFQFADVSVRLPLGHKAMPADSERPRQLRERDHYGLICSQRRFNRSRGRAMMFSQVWSASDI